ncbi:MAG TPA: PIN domain-containing protein, partial [Acetobacteraceae bacterium]|nr:PIN domain-containing protein [Acetobacteraceae bacterium]
MTRYLLDTSIISKAVKPQPSEPLLAWMAAQRDDTLFIASLTLAEIRRGILDLPAGRRRTALESSSRKPFRDLPPMIRTTDKYGKHSD